MSIDEFKLTEEDINGLQIIEDYDTKMYEEEIYSEGVSDGKESGIIETIKAMLKNNLDFKLISKITGKKISEIKEIEKTIME